MAGDWTPMSNSLPASPKVRTVARLLLESSPQNVRTSCGQMSASCPVDVRLMSNVVVGLMLRFWSWCGEHSANGEIRATDDDIDDVVSMEGFSAALREVGWLAGDGETIQIPEWDKYNSRAAKRRMKDAERKRKQRSGGDLDAKPSPQNVRIKSGQKADYRTEQNSNTPIVPKGTSLMLFDAFWSEVHNRVGKGAARKAFDRAVASVSAEQSVTPTKAAEFITDAMREFAGSAQAADEVKGTIHPATWLNQARYDDDRSIWHKAAAKPERNGHVQYPTLAEIGGRK